MGIIIKNLTKKYDEQWALNKVSFSIKQGEVVGLLGANGKLPRKIQKTDGTVVSKE